MIDTSIIPEKPDNGDPRMVVLLRNGNEIAARDAGDGHDAIIVAARLILDQRELQVGDILQVIRL
jgi:hypothetical protein